MADKTTKGTPADVAAKITNPEAMPDYKDWEEESLSLPPYWNPDPAESEGITRPEYLKMVAEGKGRWFHAMPVMIDTDDPEFVRYVCQAIKPLECRFGSSKNGEDVAVQVKEGEYFTLSAYAGLPLDRYIGTPVLVRVVGTREVGRPQPMWVFKLLVSPESKKLLDADRKQNAAIAVQKYHAMRAAKREEEVKQLSA